jgi:hypothetical protein
MLKKMSLFTMFVTFSKRKYIEVSASAFAKDEDNYITSAFVKDDDSYIKCLSPIKSTVA